MNPTLTEHELKQKEYYNRIASTYDHHYGNPNALTYRNRVFDQMLKNFDLRGKKVLDAMCGGGENSAYFLEHGADVTGVDISESQCRFYSQRLPTSQVICSSIFQTNLPDASFDFIVTESLHHLHPDVDKGIKEIIRLLKPSGYFMIWEPSSGSLLDIARKIWYRLDRTYFEDNESSIDIKKILNRHQNQLQLVRHTYGGNIAHLFVMSSMHFRIPTKIVQYYAPLFIFLEFMFQKLQTKLTSCWVLALLQKKDR